MKVTTNEDRNELSGPPTSNLKLALPCRFCGSLPDWEELDTGHRWRKMKYSKWDGWLTHECKSKYYALAGSRRYVYEDWNIQQKSRHAANNPNQ